MVEATKKQKKVAAGHSRAHRDRKREAGIPTGRQIDSSLAAVLIRGMHSRKGLEIHAGHADQLVGFAIKHGGWENSDAVREAVKRRVMFLSGLGSSA